MPRLGELCVCLYASAKLWPVISLLQLQLLGRISWLVSRPPREHHGSCQITPTPIHQEVHQPMKQMFVVAKRWYCISVLTSFGSENTYSPLTYIGKQTSVNQSILLFFCSTYQVKTLYKVTTTLHFQDGGNNS